MAIVVGTAEQRLDQADEKILLMTKVNDDLASIVGELRNEIISLREELVTRREMISELRAQVASSMIITSGQQGALANVRKVLGVNY